MRAPIGIVLGKLGRYEDALPLPRAAFETRRRLLGSGHAQTLDTERWLARRSRSRAGWTRPMDC